MTVIYGRKNAALGRNAHTCFQLFYIQACCDSAGKFKVIVIFHFLEETVSVKIRKFKKIQSFSFEGKCRINFQNDFSLSQ